MTLRHLTLSTNGISLHVAAAGDEKGPLVILLHGFPEYWYAWHRQITALAERGFFVIAPDQRGYNDSDKPRGIKAYVLDELAKDIVGLIDAFGREKASVVGHDWGGAVAWWMSVFHPARVERVVAMNAPHPLAMREMLFNSAKQRRKSWYMLYFQLPWLPERSITKDGGENFARLIGETAQAGTFSAEDLARYREAWMKPGAARGMIDWYRAMRLVITNHFEKEQMRVRIPAMLIWGRADRALGEELAPASIAYCDGGRLELVDGATHWVHHEAHERVNALLADFLRTRA